MPKWDWLVKPNYTWGFLIRVVLKATILFVGLNLIFAATMPLPLLGEITLYNWLLPGRERLPYGENPADSYNLSLNNLNAMFGSHRLAGGKDDDEFRVILIGDSSTWGFLLEPDDTLTGRLNAAGYKTADGKEIKVYNVGYPTMSLTKDLMLLDHAMQYEPDMVIWLFTLESFPRFDQLSSPIVQNNPEAARALIEEYGLELEADSDEFVEIEFPDTTIIGQRRVLADLLRLQVYGVMWATTGIDQYYPETYQLRQSDFDENVRWKGLEALDENILAFDVLAAGVERVGNVPILLINEPMFISDGENSDLRYNFFYPRWVYDDYREQIQAVAGANEWNYHDFWDAIPATEFTDSPVHMTPQGSQAFSELVGTLIVEWTG